MVLPKEEKEMDPKLECQKEERVSTIDLISRINNVQVSVNFVVTISLLLSSRFKIMHKNIAGVVGERRGATA